MDAAPSYYGPNAYTITPSQGQQRQQRLQYYSSRTALQQTGPFASTAPTFSAPYAHFPTSQSGNDVFNASHDHRNFQRRYEPHNPIYSRPMSDHLSDLRSHPPLQPFQSHLPSSNGQISGDSQAMSNSGGKRRQLPSDQGTNPRKHSRKRPRVPVVPTVEPPSAICGVGPPTSVDNHSPPSTPARSLATPSRSVSASLQLPIHKRRDTGHSTAATDVWYFCRPEESAITPSERLPPDQEETLTRRPKTPYISCKLCS